MADGNVAFPGQSDETSGNSDYNTLQLLLRVFTGGMASAMLVRVVAVYPGSALKQGTVDVLPLVNPIDSNGAPGIPHTTVHGLPFGRAQGGGAAFIADPAVGDIGAASFASRDISTVKETLAPATPASFRRFDFADGMYLVSILPAKAPTDYVHILPGGGITWNDQFGNTFMSNATGINWTDKFGNIIASTSVGITITDANGNYILMNAAGIKTHDVVVGDSIGSNTHTHPDPQGGTTGAPNPGS